MTSNLIVTLQKFFIQSNDEVNKNFAHHRPI